jgi:hypothetical protein
MRVINRVAFEVSMVAIVGALTYNIVAPLCAWIAGT